MNNRVIFQLTEIDFQDALDMIRVDWRQLSADDYDALFERVKKAVGWADWTEHFTDIVRYETEHSGDEL